MTSTKVRDRQDGATDLNEKVQYLWFEHEARYISFEGEAITLASAAIHTRQSTFEVTLINLIYLARKTSKHFGVGTPKSPILRGGNKSASGPLYT
jgi:hypothetical protein